MTTTEPRSHRWRAWVLALAMAVATASPAAAEPAKIRAGALTFGTVQWYTIDFQIMFWTLHLL